MDPEPSPVEQRATAEEPVLSDRARVILLAAGFTFLSAAFLLLLYGSRLLAPVDARNSGDDELRPLTVGTPRNVEPPINIAAPPKAGEAAPLFLLTNLEGEEVALAQYRGRPVILNFWATWCAPCIFEMPELQAAYEAHQDSELVVLGINRDEEPNVVADFLANDLDAALTFPILLDEHAVVADRYGVLNMPTTYFVDPDGNISAVHHGPLTLEQIETYLSTIS